MSIKPENIAVNAWFFHDDTPVDAAGKIADAGFSGIEFTGRQLTELNETGLDCLEQCLRYRGISLVAINVSTDLVQVAFGDLISGERPYRERAVSHVKRCVDLSSRFGCPKLVIDFGAAVEAIPAEMEDGYFMESYGEVADYALAKKIEIDFLPLPNRRRLVRRDDSLERLLGLVHRLNRTNTGFAFDTANEMAGRGSVHNFSLTSAVKPLLWENLRHVYLANHPGPYTRTYSRAMWHNLLENGWYSLPDYAELLAFLSRNGFDAQVTLHITHREPTVEMLQSERETMMKICGSMAVTGG